MSLGLLRAWWHQEWRHHILLAALRECIDPVFLPRPLLFVDALPRNRTGKLPREALQALFQARGAQKSA